MSLLLANITPEARDRALDAARPFAPAATAEIAGLVALCPRHQATPLRRLDPLAGALGVGGLWAKDERGRFGLPSFKALGGGYAVMALAAGEVSRRLGRRVEVQDLVLEPAAGEGLVFAAATAGNHGRAVAEAARLLGARAVIFVYDGVPAAQITAIAATGAEIVHVRGVYEDAIAACRSDSAARGWIVVSDTAWDGYVEIPTLVMQGYAVLAGELLADLPAAPTHLFLQAGVGGLAAAVGAHVALALGADAPRVIVVEPKAAAPLHASAAAGALTTVPAAARTNMGRLECYAASPLAWSILQGLAFAYMTVSDDQALDACARLADAGLDATPTAAAGAAGLLAAAEDPELRSALGLDAGSRVGVILTEAPDTPPAGRLPHWLD